MGIATTMVVDYGDLVYQYTPRQYWIDVREGNRLLAGGPRVNTYDMEYFRLDLQYWEIVKKEVSDSDNWQTLYFQKRQPKIIEVIQEISKERTEVFEAFGYEVVDGKYYIFTNAMETQVIDGAKWNVEKTRLSYPGYGKDALIFTRRTS